MTKAEIIERTLEGYGCEEEYRQVVIDELHKRLPEGMDIRTCEEKVECCDTCHNCYPHYR